MHVSDSSPITLVDTKSLIQIEGERVLAMRRTLVD